LPGRNFICPAVFSPCPPTGNERILIVDDEKAKSVGARDLIMKPIDKRLLSKTVRRVLDER
jgi:hypothetical protein